DLFPPDGMASLSLQLRIELGGVLVDAGHTVAGAQAADQARRMPGGASGQLVLFQEYHLAPADLRQVISDAGPDHTATADHNPGVRRKRTARRHSRFRKCARLRDTRFPSSTSFR